MPKVTRKTYKQANIDYNISVLIAKIFFKINIFIVSDAAKINQKNINGSIKDFEIAIQNWLRRTQERVNSKNKKSNLENV